MLDALLEVEAIDVYYGSLQALSGVSVSVGAGEAVAILGGNASGKSTTLKAILGLVTPRTGTIRFAGERIDGLPTPEIIDRGFGSVPEGRRVFATMSVEENILMGAYARRKVPLPEIRAGLDEIWAVFPRLHERRTQRAGTLSGGEQQMLALARAHFRRPKILCIDEPSMGLSPRFVDIVYDVLTAWRANGLSILLVEQQADRALAFADRAYVLRGGEVVLSGDAKAVAGDPQIRSAYLGD